jgi:hypothetical protein
MKMTDISGKRVIYPLLFIILSGIIIFNIVRITSSSGEEKVTAYQVEGGWGYRISQHDQIMIDQPFIPLLPGKNTFPSKRSAIKTGKLVLKRLHEKRIPVITFEDLKDLGLYRTN